MTHTTTPARSPLPLRLAASLVLLLGLVLAALRPDQPGVWLTTAASLLVGMIVWRHVRGQDPGAVARVRSALTLAAVILSIALTAALVDQLRLLPMTSEAMQLRSQGLIQALVLLVYANLMPKMPVSARWQQQVRFAGWALVLAALIHGLAWLFAPIEQAPVIGMGAIAAALLVILGRCALTSRSSKQ